MTKKELSSSPVRIGMCGFGTVGKGIFSVLKRNSSEITRRIGRSISISHLGIRRNYRDFDFGDCKISYDLLAVPTDPEVDIFIEVIGGTNLAKILVERAIDSGKNVVTANKALIAEYGNSLFTRAQKRGVSIYYEASVGGGIPVIKAIREGLAGNKIEWIVGIINGTANFILTGMSEYGRVFSQELQTAQKLGYAEADPSFDVNGTDAAHKLAILASLAFGIPINFKDIHVEGIEEIEPIDLAHASSLGFTIKHLAIARRTESGIQQRVHIALVSKKSILANVNGVMNAVQVNGDASGSSLFYGAGAGSEPTASSIIADVMDISRKLSSDLIDDGLNCGFHSAHIYNIPHVSIDDIFCPFYVRFEVKDEIGVLAQISKVFSDEGVSIESVRQQDSGLSGSVSLVLLTHAVREGSLNTAIKFIETNSFVIGSARKIRVELLDEVSQ